MTERRKRNIVIGALCGVLLLMVVGYAAFSSILNIKGTTNISSNWDIRITNVESKNVVGSASNAEEPEWDNLTATFKTNLEVPGDSIEYDVTVENKGTLNAKLDKINMTASNNPAIKFTATGLKEGDKLNAGSSAILTVKVEYLTGVEVDNKNLSASLTVTLDYVQSNVGEGGIATPPASDTLIENVVTEGDGLYEDSTEAGRYVYRGTDPDNYITFNGEEAGWRIISVETDGTLKIMKKDSIGEMKWDIDTHTSNDWSRPATLNTYLNGDYYDTLANESKENIQIHNFNIGGQSFADVSNLGLKGQIEAEKRIVWNGNIGLISVSDYLKANSNLSQCENFKDVGDNIAVCKETNYIIPSSEKIWTITPYSISAFVIDKNGDLQYYNQPNPQHVYPALFLKSDITLSGTGTASDPYTIK